MKKQKGKISYLPLFQYLAKNNISISQFQSDLKISDRNLLLLRTNAGVSSKLLERICSFYSISLCFIVKMDYELTTFTELANFDANDSSSVTYPSMKDIFEKIDQYILKPIEIDEIAIVEVKDFVIRFSTVITDNNNHYTPAEVKELFTSLAEIRSNLADPSIKCHFIRSITKPEVDENGKMHSTHTLVIGCDFSEYEKLINK